MRSLILAIALAACSKKPSGPSVAKGRDFTFPIPAGWSNADELAPAGSVAYFEDELIRDDAFRGSIVVTPVPVQGPLPKATAADCKPLGEAMAAQVGAKLVTAELIDLPTGPACQWDVDGGRQQARGIVMSGPRDAWVIICNHDPDDAAVLAACKRAATGWKFE